MHDDSSALEREANYFHSCFFPHRQIDDLVVRRYVAANRQCFPVVADKDRKMVEAIVVERLDAEAIEFAIRSKRGSCLLTRKIQILFFLVEVRSAYYRHFINQTPGLRRACFRLLGSLLQTVWKFAKGRYLVWRYGLV